jgi:carboxylesterase type B
MLKIVKTKYGYIQGVLSNAGYALFKGVPYAKAPINERRWKAPEDLDSWDGIKICDEFGPACMQYDRWSKAVDDITDDSVHKYIKVEGFPYPPKMSEDCLYLNIWTPANTENDKLPVCVYIHGGGLQQWYGSDYEYCGDKFCEHGCIVVGITYRLNVFGFFAHPDLEDENHSSGNYGLLDQIKAIQWVYENIENFGGDKNKIMCFGQSAGGSSVLAALVSPLSSKYIKRVSLQSCGGLNPLLKEASKEEIYNKGKEFMRACNCTTIEQLRKLDAKYLRDINDKVFGMFGGFGFNIDGYILPDYSSKIIARGELKDVEMIVGCTIDEGANQKKPMFGVNLCADILALCKMQILNNKKPVYSYVFSRTQPGDNAGVPHSCDNRYQFGTLDACWRPYTEKDYELSEKMIKYWTNFAKTGNPNSDDLQPWLAYDEKEHKQLRLDIDKCEMHDFNIDTNNKLEQESNAILENYRS